MYTPYNVDGSLSPGMIRMCWTDIIEKEFIWNMINMWVLLANYSGVETGIFGEN